jgi:Icc-related predicted phosphoesterase
MHLTTFEFGGLKFGGFCGSWKYKPKGHYLFEQEDVEKMMIGFPPVDVFLGHNSPRLVHDREDEVHTGFVAFNRYITDAQPKYFFHGHQHENVETNIGPTRVIGTYGHRFLVIPDQLRASASPR